MAVLKVGPLPAGTGETFDQSPAGSSVVLSERYRSLRSMFAEPAGDFAFELESVMGLLDLLANVTESDLKEIDERIAVIETEIGQLRELRKVVAIKVGVEKPRKWGGPRKKAPVPAEEQPKAPAPPAAAAAAAPRATPQVSRPEARKEDSPAEETQIERHRRHARSYIMANGPTPMPELAKKCGIHAASIKSVVRHPWFVSTPQGIQVTRQ